MQQIKEQLWVIDDLRNDFVRKIILVDFVFY